MLIPVCFVTFYVRFWVRVGLAVPSTKFSSTEIFIEVETELLPLV
jgi:hypothetical protein